MISRLRPRGLRARLALAISAIVTVVVAGSFLAIHQGTGSELLHRIDSGLTEQYAEFRQEALPGVRTPAQLDRSARRFIASQRYHPESRIFIVDVSGGAHVTNQSDVVQSEAAAEASEREAGDRSDRDSTLLDAPDGFSNVSTDEAGNLRVYSRPLLAGTERIGTFRVADPRLPIERAQAGLRRAFLVVGLIALVFSIAVAAWVATLVTSPLRRMARVASGVDAGELTRRIGSVGTGDEITMLADSFDRMLDRLEAAFNRQREFVSDASHELRTPLTVLRGQIELLTRKDADRAERERVLETVLRELDHMNRLVDDMLVLARAEGGELVQPRTIDLSDFLEDLERDLPLLGDRDYRLEGVRDGELVVDPDRLWQVFRNLVRNAVGQTAADDRITVGVVPRDDRIEFSVTDTGSGLPPEQLDRVFDRFHRTDAGRARDEGGSGLGLAIARAIVEAHGGRIWAQSSPTEGASFRFELPGYSGDRAGVTGARSRRW